MDYYLGKLSVANQAPEGFLAAVCSHVGREVSGLRERFVTRRAAVRLLARVGPLVGLERTGPRVRLATDVTLVVTCKILERSYSKKKIINKKINEKKTDICINIKN